MIDAVRFNWFGIFADVFGCDVEGSLKNVGTIRSRVAPVTSDFTFNEGFKDFEVFRSDGSQDFHPLLDFE